MMVKRGYLIVSLLFFVMGACLMGCRKNTAEPTTDITPVETQAPTATEAPVEVASPSPTRGPNLTIAPAATETPVVTEAPEVTEWLPPEGETDEDSNITPVQLGVSVSSVGGMYYDEFSVYKDDVCLMYTKYDLPYLSPEDAESYPLLAQAFEDGRILIETQMKNMLEIGGEAAQSDYDAGYFDAGYPYFETWKLAVQRADSSVVSVLICDESYWGGVHPVYGFYAMNTDAKTGKELELSDVLVPEYLDNDCEAIVNIVTEQILTGNPDEDYWFDMSAVINGLQEGSIPWTIGYQGVSLYINPYLAASYAAGSFVIDITFAEHPELFNGAYVQVPEAYMIQSLNSAFSYDFDNDGVIECIDLYLMGVDSSDVSLVCKYWEANNYDEMKTYSFEAWSIEESIESVLIHTAEGRNYIYATVTMENDMDWTYCLKLENDEITLQGGTGLSLAPVSGDIYDSRTVWDPEHFRFETRNDFFGTTFETAWYKVGEDGLPEKTDAFYYFNRYSDYYPLTLLQDMEMTEVDTVNELLGNAVTMKAGEHFRLYRVDGTGITELEAENGGIYRIVIDKTYYEDIDWTYFGYIGGISIDEYFDGISYAG